MRESASSVVVSRRRWPRGWRYNGGVLEGKAMRGLGAAEIRRYKAQLEKLPQGSVVRKVIAGKVRYYRQWHEGGKTRSECLSAAVRCSSCNSSPASTTWSSGTSGRTRARFTRSSIRPKSSTSRRGISGTARSGRRRNAPLARSCPERCFTADWTPPAVPFSRIPYYLARNAALYGIIHLSCGRISCGWAAESVLVVDTKLGACQ